MAIAKNERQNADDILKTSCDFKDIYEYLANFFAFAPSGTYFSTLGLFLGSLISCWIEPKSSFRRDISGVCSK